MKKNNFLIKLKENLKKLYFSNKKIFFVSIFLIVAFVALCVFALSSSNSSTLPLLRINVFDSFIHVDASIEWAQDASKPVAVYKKTARSAIEFKKLAEEVVNNGNR